MRMFHSKHQKLILQCYPPGKATDKKANPSELSYLLYYASNRRVKLEKVMVFLEKKTRSDANHNRAGNLHVTLEILSSLIEKCADDVNVIAGDVLSILQRVLDIGDLQLCKSVVQCYTTLCQHLNPGLFSGDQIFVHQFTQVSDGLIGLNGDHTHALEWEMMRLLSIEAASNVYNFNLDVGRNLMSVSMPTVVRAVQHQWSSGQALSKQVKANITRDEDLVKITSRVMADHDSKMRSVLTSEEVSSGDVNDEALYAVKTLFDTTSTWQVSELVKSVVQVDASGDWISGFIELATTYVPVQIRFVVLVTLLDRLKALAQKGGSIQSQLLYAKCVLKLVSSKVSMIGLSVSDVIQQILNLQTQLVLKQSQKISKDELKSLSMSYSDSVCHLATRIYYADQVPDSVQEILVKVDSLGELARTSNQPDQLHGLIISFLDDIQEVFALLSKKKSSISRNKVPFEVWQSSLRIISASPKNYKFSKKQFVHIQDKYLQTFADFITKELGVNNSVPQLDRRQSITDVADDDQEASCLEPNFRHYVSSRDNFITDLLIHVDKYLSFDQVLEAEQLMNDVLVDVVATLGINFFVNFIPYFYYWVQGDQGQTVVVKQTFGFTLMFHCLRVLDSKYPQCRGYVSSSKFYLDVMQDIDSRKNNSMWVFDIDRDIGGKPRSQFTGVTFQSTRANMKEFVEGNDFLDQYVDVDTPLILDLNKLLEVPPPSGLVTPRSTKSMDDESHFSYSLGRNGSRLGLGNANDISSIHSELMHGQNTFLKGAPPLPQLNINGGDISGYTGHNLLASSVTEVKYNSPKVTELRDVMQKRQKEGVLSRSMVSDMKTILGGLEDDDDRLIVV